MVCCRLRQRDLIRLMILMGCGGILRSSTSCSPAAAAAVGRIAALRGAWPIRSRTRPGTSVRRFLTKPLWQRSCRGMRGCNPRENKTENKQGHLGATLRALPDRRRQLQQWGALRLCVEREQSVLELELEHRSVAFLSNLLMIMYPFALPHRHLKQC